MRVAVAMSGGVDSSVTARLLLGQGYEVEGFFLLLAQADPDADVARVRHIGRHLGIPVHVVDLREVFRRRVLDYFAASYAAGRTPNPCVVCNPVMKFGALLDAVLARGCDRLATGHYARLRRDDTGRVHLHKGIDTGKDQSYFLHRLGQEALGRLLFPLGERTKDETRRLAAAFGLAGLHGSESQDVCFLAGGSVPAFLDRFRGRALPGPGPIETEDGRVLGRHQGIHRYTVGQRRGLGLPDATPWYVLALEPERNVVVVAKAQRLWRRELAARDCAWVSGRPPAPEFRCLVRIRHRHQEAPATVIVAEDGRAFRVRFDEAQRAVTPGQFAVLYRDDEVLGGGEIDG